MIVPFVFHLLLFGSLGVDSGHLSHKIIKEM